jgi:hypothetical protein
MGVRCRRPFIYSRCAPRRDGPTALGLFYWLQRCRPASDCESMGSSSARNVSLARASLDLTADTEISRARRPLALKFSCSPELDDFPTDRGQALGPLRQKPRLPAIASPTTSSAAPKPYISAVSPSFVRRSIPVRNALIAASRSLSSIYQVARPNHQDFALG